MVILEIFTKNVNIVYKSNIISKATLLVFIFGLVSVVLPFLLAYKSKGFWVKRDVFYEQPDVKFKGEYIFVATTNSPTRPVITCSTLPYYEHTFEFLDTCASIKVREEDKDFDGKVDELFVNLHVNLPEETELRSLYIIIPVDYKLHRVCPFQMQGAIIFHQFLPISINNFVIIGDVMIVQSSALYCNKNHIDNSYNYSIIANVKNTDDYEIMNIITSYSRRNTVLKNYYTNFITGKTGTFLLDLRVRYPEDKFYYKPGFWQIIKWAWIQYFAIYIVVSWFVTTIKSYIFNKRLILFYEDNPFKKKQ